MVDFTSIWNGFNNFCAKLLPDSWGVDSYAGVIGAIVIVLILYFFFSKDKK